MPRQSKGARLWLRRRRGRSAQWVILDRGCEIRTGASANDIGAAERALEDYIAKKRQPDFGDGNPANVLVADVLAEYGEQHGPSTKRADLIGGAISKLLDFFGEKTAAEVNSRSCQAYVRWRTQQTDARAKRGGKSIKTTTARRDSSSLALLCDGCGSKVNLTDGCPLVSRRREARVSGT